MTDNRAERLSLYLAASARRPVDYSSGWDCLAGFVARWVEQERGVDGAKPWRGLYRTEASCLALLGREGGLLSVMARGASAVGLTETLDPELGDIGIIQAESQAWRGMAGSIRTRIGWATLTARGLQVAPHNCLRAWRV